MPATTAETVPAPPGPSPAMPAPATPPSGPSPAVHSDLGTDATQAWEGTPPRAAGVSPPGGEETAPLPSELEVPGIRRFPVVPVAVGGAAVVAAVVAAVLFLGGGEGPAATPPPAAATKAAAAAKAKAPGAPRKLWVRSSPAGAQVLEGGRSLGETPLQVAVDPERVRRLKLKLDGYAAFTVAVDPDMKEAPTVSLQPSRPPPKAGDSAGRKRRGKGRAKGKRRGKAKAAAPKQPAAKPSGGGLLYDDALK